MTVPRRFVDPRRSAPPLVTALVTALATGCSVVYPLGDFHFNGPADAASCAMTCGGGCVNTQTDPAHCGGCGHACVAAQATAACAAGRCVVGRCAPGFGDCNGDPADGCEADLTHGRANCGGCGLNPAEACNGRDDDCDGVADNGVLGTGSQCPAASCAVVQADSMSGDGTYWIRGAAAPVQVRCLMAVDGGGWTLVGNFPAGTGANPAWNDPAGTGTNYTDTARLFKLPDAAINALRATVPATPGGFRAHGTALLCVAGACQPVDTTEYWRPSCTYASNARSEACDAAFRDVAFLMPTRAPGATPCAPHWGLNDSDCGALPSNTGIITNTDPATDAVMCVGAGTSPGAVCDGATTGMGSQAALQIWVR